MPETRVAVIGGDGIGPEVVGSGMEVMRAAAKNDPSARLDFTEFPWGCEYYLEHGRMMPEDGIETLSGFDEMYLGAVGWPMVPEKRDAASSPPSNGRCPKAPGPPTPAARQPRRR